MRTADKVALVNTVNRANLLAGSAAGTFFVIYGCKIIYDLDSIVRTGLFALAAGYTAVGAISAHVCALVVIITTDYNT